MSSKVMYAERISGIVASCKKSESRNTMVTSDLGAEVVIWPFRACAMHPVIIKRGEWRGKEGEGKGCGVTNVESLIHQCQNIRNGREWEGREGENVPA